MPEFKIVIEVKTRPQAIPFFVYVEDTPGDGRFRSLFSMGRTVPEALRKLAKVIEESKLSEQFNTFDNANT